MAVFETFFQIGAGVGIAIVLFAVLPSVLIIRKFLR